MNIHKEETNNRQLVVDVSSNNMRKYLPPTVFASAMSIVTVTRPLVLNQSSEYLGPMTWTIAWATPPDES
jgi:hypothetical protein